MFLIDDWFDFPIMIFSVCLIMKLYRTYIGRLLPCWSVVVQRPFDSTCMLGMNDEGLMLFTVVLLFYCISSW